MFYYYSIHSVLITLLNFHNFVPYFFSNFFCPIQIKYNLSDLSSYVFRCISCFYLCKCCWQSLKHLFRSYYSEPFSMNWLWHCKTRVTSYEFRVESLKTRVKIQKSEFKSTNWGFKSTSYEFKSTNH